MRRDWRKAMSASLVLVRSDGEGHTGSGLPQAPGLVPLTSDPGQVSAWREGPAGNRPWEREGRNQEAKTLFFALCSCFFLRFFPWTSAVRGEAHLTGPWLHAGFASPNSPPPDLPTVTKHRSQGRRPRLQGQPL